MKFFAGLDLGLDRAPKSREEGEGLDRARWRPRRRTAA